MKMEKGAKNDENSNIPMDNLAALNIVPFLSLMNMVEVKYLHIPEVYRTMLAILCDYNPVCQNNIIKTRRYLSVLLAREPELAQCLLNFIDTPEEPSPTPIAPDSSAMDTFENKNYQQMSAQITDEKLDDYMHTEGTSKQFGSEQSSSSQDPDKKDVALDCLNKCFMSTQTTTHGQTNIQTDSVLTESPTCTDLHPTVIDLQTSVSDQMYKSVPVVNIYHKDLFASTKSAVMVTRAGQPQATPFILPGFFTSQPNPANPSALDLTSTSLMASKHRDQIILTPNLTPPSGQTQVDTKSPALLARMTDSPSMNVKSSKSCSAAQTQTSFTSADRTNFLHNMASSVEGPGPVNLSRVTPSTSSTDTLMNMVTSADGKPSTVTPNICLSKLLGQPSVSYLPAGHFIENRDSIIGGGVCKPKGTEKLSYNSTVLNSKMNSAAAKLHLLSTQAGNEKSGSIQTGYGKTITSVSSNSVSLSSSAPLVQKDITMKTTVKAISKPGCRKTVTLSKIVPVLKIDHLTGQDTQMTSYDKQIQVGQRQIGKKSKTTGKKDQACQMQISIKQLANSLENLHDGQPLTDCQKQSYVIQPTDNTENSSFGESHQNEKEVQSMSATPQKCLTTRKLRTTKQKIQNSNMSIEQQTLDDKPIDNDKKQGESQREHLLPEIQEHQKLASTQEDKNYMPKSPARLLDKQQKQSENVIGVKPAATKRQKVKVVAVSMGTNPSLSAFPYIQQMILPDGQVSTIAHNMQTATASGQHAELHDVATKISKTSARTEICHTKEEREPLINPASQICLSQSQLKLSVSIQTPTVNCSNSSQHKPKNTTNHHPANLPKLNNESLMEEAAPSCSGMTGIKNQDPSCNTSVVKNVFTDATNLIPDAQSFGTMQTKRKRSPSIRRNTTAKIMKQHF